MNPHSPQKGDSVFLLTGGFCGLILGSWKNGSVSTCVFPKQLAQQAFWKSRLVKASPSYEGEYLGIVVDRL